MKRLLSLTFASCTLIVPALANLPAASSLVETSAYPTSPAPFDTDTVELGSMRAGWTASPSQLDDSERAELLAASERAPDLGALRAGTDGPSDNQWKWIGIGAAVVLLIVLL